MANQENQETVNQEQETTEQKTYTQEEVNKLLQAEGDRRVAQALKTQEKKTKDKSVLGLDEQERTLKQQKETIEQLQSQLSQYEAKHQTETFKTLLANHGLPEAISDYVVIPEDDTAKLECIGKLEGIFKDAITAEVKKRLAGVAPNATAKAQGPDFRKMTLSQKQELLSRNPDMYNILSKSNN